MTPADRGPGEAAAWARGWAQRWTRLMTRYVPWQLEAEDRVVDVLEALGTTSRVLELGCGPGAFAARLTERLPGVDLTCVDADPRVLAVAAALLDDRARLVQVDVTAAGWSRQVGSVDAVVSCFVLHMTDRAGYATVAAELAGLLRRGGVFVDLDLVPLAEPRLTAPPAAPGGGDTVSAYLADLGAATGLPAPEGRDARREEPPAATVQERTGALLGAGFRSVELVERRRDTALLVALR